MKKSKAEARREALQLRAQGDQIELFELETTRCARIGDKDRRTSRSHQYRETHMAERSTVYDRGRRSND